MTTFTNKKIPDCMKSAVKRRIKQEAAKAYLRLLSRKQQDKDQTPTEPQ